MDVSGRPESPGVLGAALRAFRRARRYRRLSTSPGPWSWARQSAQWATVRVDASAGMAVATRVDLDLDPPVLPVVVTLASSASSTPPAIAWLDDLRARVRTMALEVSLTADRLEVSLPLDGTPLDWRILGTFVAGLDALGRPGRMAWLGPPETLPARDCPACRAPMRSRAGPHLEDECPSCHGCFFEGGVAAAILQERFGLSPAEVLAAADATGVGGSCPACARPLRPVLLDEVIGDVCAGCGGVWLDPGERETLLP